MRVSPTPRKVTNYQRSFKYDVNDHELEPSPDKRFYKIRDEMVEFNEAFLKAKNMTGNKGKKNHKHQ